MNDIKNKNNEISFNVSNKCVNLTESALKLTMCGVGYLGTDDVDYHAKSYIRWHDMIHRCYNKKFHERQPQYKECAVCEEWKNYSIFRKWYKENYYTIGNEQMDLDKDILTKGNKVHSPDTCCIVPHGINTLFINGKKKRGNLPVGVYFDKDKVKYRAYMSCHGKSVKLGTFEYPVDAFMVYKGYKETVIKNMAEQYRGLIPDKVYRAMLEWKIEIED